MDLFPERFLTEAPLRISLGTELLVCEDADVRAEFSWKRR